MKLGALSAVTAKKNGVLAAIGLAAGVALLAAACGGSSAADSDTDTNKPTTTTAQPTSTGNKPAPTAANNPEPTNTPDGMNEPANGDPPTSIEVRSIDSKFDVTTIEAPANTEFAVALVNDGVLPHNISFLTKAGGEPLADGAAGKLILEGETAVTRFVTPGPGTYFFVCIVHPDLMKGDFIVR